MSEVFHTFETENPIEIFGVNNANIDLLKEHFPKLKFLARGNVLKIVGNQQQLAEAEQILLLILEHFHKHNELTQRNVEEILHRGEANEETRHMDGIITYGNGGKVIKARTINQKKLCNAVFKNDMVFAVGPAGTGKTYTAVALAVRALKNREVKRIVLTRPAVEAGENLGYLPGDLKDKLDPYLRPLYDALRDMIPFEKLNAFIEKGTIEIAPLAFMRGRTLDNAFVILDEAQNATESQLKMFLTRMGQSAKFVINGDMTQIDLPRNIPSGLKQANAILKNIPGIEFIYLDEKDVVRHTLVKNIITAYKTVEDQKEQAKQHYKSTNK